MRYVIAVAALAAGCAGTKIAPVPGVDPEMVAWAAGVQAGAALCEADSTGADADTWGVLSRFAEGLADGGEGCQ